jgi:hypothetical protein
MSVARPRERRRLLSELLKTLREELKSAPPIYFAEISGIPPGAYQAFHGLAYGICEPSDATRSYGPKESGDMPFFFGFVGDFDFAWERLLAVAPKICDTIGKTIVDETKEPMEPIDRLEADKQALMAAYFTYLLTDIFRAKQPESLQLPSILKGKIFCDPKDRASIWFPGGKVTHPPILRDDAARTAFWESLCGGRISINVLKTPIIQSCALTIARMLEQSPSRPGMRIAPDRLRKAIGKKSRLLLKGPDDNPVIDGQQQPLLSPREYKAVKAIVDAKALGQMRLSDPELDRKSGITDARKVLKTLANRNRSWKGILQFAGRKGLGYGIK